jgi:phage-related holin
MIERVLELLEHLRNAWLVKSLISVGSSALLALFGAWREAYSALMILMLLDLVVGVWAAIRTQTISAKVAREKTIVKVAGYAIVVIAAYQVERTLQSASIGFGSDYTLGVALIYLVATEFLSVIQNVEKLTGRRFRIFQPQTVLNQLAGKEETRNET